MPTAVKTDINHLKKMTMNSTLISLASEECGRANTVLYVNPGFYFTVGYVMCCVLAVKKVGPLSSVSDPY